jgi:hypothetical protein
VIQKTPEELMEKLASVDGKFMPELMAWMDYYRCQIKELKDALRESVKEQNALKAELILLMQGKEPKGESSDRLVTAGVARYEQHQPVLSSEEVWKGFQQMLADKQREKEARKALREQTEKRREQRLLRSSVSHSLSHAEGQEKPSPEST